MAKDKSDTKTVDTFADLLDALEHQPLTALKPALDLKPKARKKPGPKPLGERAMTPAEKQKRYRAKLKKKSSAQVNYLDIGPWADRAKCAESAWRILRFVGAEGILDFYTDEDWASLDVLVTANWEASQKGPEHPDYEFFDPCKVALLLIIHRLKPDAEVPLQKDFDDDYSYFEALHQIAIRSGAGTTKQAGDALWSDIGL